MKNTILASVMVALLISAAGGSFAQAPAQPSSDPLTAGQKTLHNGVKNFILRAAEKMPEDKFSFKPAPEVRTYGQLLAHIADAQYLFGSAILGEENPRPQVEQNKTTKAEIVRALKEAFAYSDKAYERLTDREATQTVKFFGQDFAKLTLLSLNTAHDNEHYGNLVTYLRMNGIVPPSSEPRQ
jgi:uncharacterized damage-inducible protein DinB